MHSFESILPKNLIENDSLPKKFKIEVSVKLINAPDGINNNFVLKNIYAEEESNKKIKLRIHLAIDEKNKIESQMDSVETKHEIVKIENLPTSDDEKNNKNYTTISAHIQHDSALSTESESENAVLEKLIEMRSSSLETLNESTQNEGDSLDQPESIKEQEKNQEPSFLEMNKDKILEDYRRLMENLVKAEDQFIVQLPLESENSSNKELHDNTISDVSENTLVNDSSADDLIVSVSTDNSQAIHSMPLLDDKKVKFSIDSDKLLKFQNLPKDRLNKLKGIKYSMTVPLPLKLNLSCPPGSLTCLRPRLNKDKTITLRVKSWIPV